MEKKTEPTIMENEKGQENGHDMETVVKHGIRSSTTSYIKAGHGFLLGNM